MNPKIKQTNKQYTKKANVVSIVALLVVSILSGFILLTYVSSTSELVSTSIEDQACRNFIAIKDTSAFKLYDFVNNINIKCKKEKIIIKGDSKEENLKQIGNSMNKCWNRYGSGEFDFLGNFGTEGSWCFTCAKLNFKDTDSEPISFSKEFMPWALSEPLKLANGTKTTYGKYIQIKYLNTSDKINLEVIYQGIIDLENIQEDSDYVTQPIINALKNKNTELFDLANKDLNPNEDLFVVYRYDRIPKSTMELIGSVGGGFLIGMAAESILTMGAGIVLAPFTFGGSLIYSTGRVLNKAKNVYDTSKKLLKFREIIEKISTSVKFSKARKAIKVFKNLDGTTESMYKGANALSKPFPEISKKLMDIGKKMDDLKIKKLDDIKPSNYKTQEKLDKLHDMVDTAIDNGFMSSNTIDKAIGIETKYVKKLKELRDLEKKLENVNKGIKAGTPAATNYLEMSKKFLKGILYITPGLIGATAVEEYNSNYIQYVDLLSKEQYYRLCGTEPIIN